MSFVTLKDAFGTTQLVARLPRSATAAGDRLPTLPVSRNLVEELSNIPRESTVLVQGIVKTRPQQAQRDVSSVLPMSRLISLTRKSESGWRS